MPNLPTSLILVLLAVAWLWVLVPMFARSREAVPETDDGAAGFRVLRRAARLRRPRVHRRHDSDEEDDLVADDHFDAAADDRYDDDFADENDDADGDLVEALVDRDDDFADEDFAGEDFDDDFAGQQLTEEDFDRDVRHDVRHDVRRAVGAADVAADDHEYDAADEWESAHTASMAEPHRRRPAQRASAPAGSPAHRPGRGGFDPEHDAATAAFRYRRRRFVTLLLVLLTGGLVAGAMVGISDKLWIGAAVTGLVLVGYLTYLSRQVRIEREISARRRARMQRALQIRPAARREADPVSPYRSDRSAAARPAPHRSRPAAAGHGPARRPAARSSQLPPMHRKVGTVVDLDDDDPAFDDLDHYEPVVYRRAAGQ
ncbi:divisome protein SepX/GlpR [Nakamurella lactea]|uniref:divisome protein SepX/GlpR n=1 Tax=Nakamurella lactea TaxID=459515 RepID=UPI0004201790|nr:gephyrin-like molybdotransferase receptor GlpR [Nakamurella lactea]